MMANEFVRANILLVGQTTEGVDVVILVDEDGVIQITEE